MKLSVIVPVYNAEKYLDACVTSILTQSFADLELILVDDGSPDNCLAICRKRAEQDSRVRVIHQENKGQAAARNTGLNAAQGEWISFVDSDDTLAPGCYEALFAAAGGRQADVISYGFTYISPDGTPRGTATVPDFYAPDKAAFKEIFPRYRTTCFSSPCKLYRRALIERNGIRFHEELKAAEDTIFNFDVFTAAQGIVHVETPFYQYWQHNNASVTRSGMTNVWDPDSLSYRRLAQFLDDCGWQDIREEILNDWLTRAAFNQLCQYTSPVTRFTPAQRTRGLKALYVDARALPLLRAELSRQPATPQNLLCRLSAALKMPFIITLPLRLLLLLRGKNDATRS